MQLFNEGRGATIPKENKFWNAEFLKLGNAHNLVLFWNRTKSGTALIETVLIGDFLYIKEWTLSNSTSQASKIIPTTQNKINFWNPMRETWKNSIYPLG